MSATEVQAWKKKTALGQPIQVPSGNTALVRRVSIDSFLQEGIIPNSLRGLVMDSLKSKTAPQISAADFNETDLLETLRMMDAITIRCVIEPKVSPIPVVSNKEATEEEPAGTTIPIDDPRRSADVLYVDEVDYDDKVFIWQYALGGTKNLDRFRSKLEESMGTVSASSDVEDSTILPSGD